MQTTKPRSITRTWEAVTHHEMDRVVVMTTTQTVTLTADQHGHKTAQIDGKPAQVAHAVSILNRAARVQLVSEYRAPEPAPVIGKARAARLHRLMARLGLPSGQHYALAAAALGEWAPLPSLATLTEQEARAVWAHLCRLYPSAAA